MSKTKKQRRPANVLFAEDSFADIELTKAYMEVEKLNFNFFAVRDGEEAIAFLCQDREYADKPRPDIVFLDVNLPRKDGKETLRFIKTMPELQGIPVVMLSGSDHHEDIDSCLTLGAVEYLVKPFNGDKLQKISDSIKGCMIVNHDGQKLLCVEE